MNYLCSCGETDPEKMMNRGKGRKARNLCKSCHSKNTTKRGSLNKQRWIDYKGGSCELCGYDRYSGALEFHHIDPTKKDPNFQSFRYWGEERVLRELEHCILLCSNCHREVHAGYVNIGAVAQMARATALQAVGPGFKSL